VLVLAIVLVPLFFFEEILPVPGDTLRAFFAAPPNVAPPPPPPPPAPPAGVRAMRRAPAAARPSAPPTFMAPVEVPEVLPPEEALDLDVQGGGVEGGVEGGVPGGVVGGIVGGLPSEPAGPAPRIVRIGGKIVAPKLLEVVKPEYPLLAAQIRLKGIVILEAVVGVDGRVKEVKLLRGPPLLADSAMEAVKRWRYMPLLLNGTPVDFILTVTINFNLTEALVTH
jgi:protein TonB